MVAVFRIRFGLVSGVFAWEIHSRIARLVEGGKDLKLALWGRGGCPFLLSVSMNRFLLRLGRVSRSLESSASASPEVARALGLILTRNSSDSSEKVEALFSVRPGNAGGCRSNRSRGHLLRRRCR